MALYETEGVELIGVYLCNDFCKCDKCIFQKIERCPKYHKEQNPCSICDGASLDEMIVVGKCEFFKKADYDFTERKWLVDSKT